MESGFDRDAVWQAALKAKASQLINMKQLAARVGWSQPMMPKFLKTGQGTTDKIHALGVELKKLGFLPSDPYSGLAIQFRNTANILDDPSIDTSVKERAVKEVITSYGDTIKGKKAQK